MHRKNSAPKPDYAVPALDKGLDVLETLAGSAVPLALAELGVRLGRNSSELFRMVNRLEARGYLARDPLSGKYTLSLRLYELAHLHSPVERLVKAAREPMQAFCEATQESCHLSILNRDELLVVAQSDSPAKVRLSIEVGSRFDLLQTASGRLLLAYLPDADRAALLKRLRGSRAAAARLADTLRGIGEAGRSVAENETMSGVRDVVVPVGSGPSGVLAALACSMLMRGASEPGGFDHAAALEKAAREISRRLGLTWPAAKRTDTFSS